MIEQQSRTYSKPVVAKLKGLWMLSRAAHGMGARQSVTSRVT